MSDAPLSSEESDGKVRRSFVMFSSGEMPEIDRLAVLMELMREMNDKERLAAIGYVTDFYGYRVQPK